MLLRLGDATFSVLGPKHFGKESHGDGRGSTPDEGYCWSWSSAFFAEQFERRRILCGTGGNEGPGSINVSWRETDLDMKIGFVAGKDKARRSESRGGRVRRSLKIWFCGDSGRWLQDDFADDARKYDLLRYWKGIEGWR